MKKMNILPAIFSILLFPGCFNEQQSNNGQNPEPRATPFTLNDYFDSRPDIDKAVDSVFLSWTPEQRLSRMIITSAGELGKPQSKVVQLVKNQQTGGVIFLKGKSTDHSKFIDSLNSLSSLPLFYSIDAEPSLIKRRLPDIKEPFPAAAEIADSAESYQTSERIARMIRPLGFHWNYAPVVDLGTDNEAITTRSFGSDQNEVITKAKSFTQAARDNNVIECIKHFPGHGRVKGDTHKERVYIDGELTELPVYKPLIKSGVLSVMVAHVAVRNNEQYGTNGVPASCSRKLITGLLRNELGFEGIIITDAMNMEAAVKEGESAPLTAAKAGNDMILMPPDEAGLLNQMLSVYNSEAEFQTQWDNSVKRIIRLMFAAGMF